MQLNFDARSSTLISDEAKVRVIRKMKNAFSFKTILATYLLLRGIKYESF